MTGQRPSASIVLRRRWSEGVEVVCYDLAQMMGDGKSNSGAAYIGSVPSMDSDKHPTWSDAA